jgi:hypothetical protein
MSEAFPIFPRALQKHQLQSLLSFFQARQRLLSTALLKKKGGNGKPVQKTEFDLHTGIKAGRDHTRILDM